jgi:hypothetical protein
MGNLLEGTSLYVLLQKQPDFQCELTLLQHFGDQIGIMVNCTPKEKYKDLYKSMDLLMDPKGIISQIKDMYLKIGVHNEAIEEIEMIDVFVVLLVCVKDCVCRQTKTTLCKRVTCTIRESNPGQTDGNGLFYH